MQFVQPRAWSADSNFDSASNEGMAEGEQDTDGQINDTLAFNRAVTTEMRAADWEKLGDPSLVM